MTKTEDRASRIRQRLRQVPVEWEAETARIVRLREMLAGYVYRSRRRCGKRSCRCARGELHESWVVATTVGGKRTTRSLGGGRRARVQQLTENYRAFRQAQGRLRRLGKEAVELSRELERLLRAEPFAKEERR